MTKDPDQYSTDFQKAIKRTLEEQSRVRHFLILGTIAGRVDQGVGLLGELYREQHSVTNQSESQTRQGDQ